MRGRHARIRTQSSFEIVNPRTRIAIDRHLAQPLAKLALQISGQRIRIFHRIELDEARAALHGISVHGLHILAKES